MTSSLSRHDRRPGPGVRSTVLLLAIALATLSCSYTSGDGVAGANGDEPATSSTSGEPAGPLAFSVEGLDRSNWRVFNTDDGLNLRVAPGVDSDSLGRIATGTTVTATGNVTVIDETSWFYVETGSQAGWVHSGYLAPVDTDENAVAAPEPTPALATTEAAWPADTQLVIAAQPAANLREGPGGDTIVELVTGTSVVVTGAAAGDWTEIRTSNLRGWIYTPLLAEIVEDTDSRFPAATPVGPAEGLSGVNLRFSIGGDVIVGLPANEVALATGRSQDDWTEVTHRGVTGWVRTAKLRAVQVPAAALVPTMATIEGAGGPVTVHLGPSGLEPILEELEDQTEVLTTGLSIPTGWSEIELDGVRTGWVPTIFLTFA